jgi:hypothetical protein
MAVKPVSNGEPDCAWATIGSRTSGTTMMPTCSNRRAWRIELLGTLSESLFRNGHLQQPKDQLRYWQPSADFKESPMTFFLPVMLERNTRESTGPEEVRIQSRSRATKRFRVEYCGADKMKAHRRGGTAACGSLRALMCSESACWTRPIEAISNCLSGL